MLAFHDFNYRTTAWTHHDHQTAATTRDPRPATTQVGALSTPLEQRCWQRQYLLIFKLMLLSEGDPLYSERGLGKSVDFINGNSLLSLVDPGLLKCRSR
uniref:Uncharacterized protein n=1 Tax=Candidatus Kentrum sp. TC TaxID=2126339 RepID=A0A450YWX4_9GAMM|nr:MAG: hypothetical protein BECKTC1821E_GA0114239_105813 [Candidatus Kentron sp. TC]